jgi:glycosyltransferase involved in cell wall biosynthesis
MILPSEYYKNNQLSVIETLCLRTPVLGANIGGIPELLEEGRNGILFESGNVFNLQKKIEKMFNTQFDYPALAQKNQTRFSSQTYYKQLMEVYIG